MSKRMTRHTGIICVFIASLVFLVTTPVLAWNSLGHKIIAQIAYEHLTPKARREVDHLTRLLDKKHKSGALRFDLLSVLADRIRSDGVHAFDRWHYMNLDVSLSQHVLAEQLLMYHHHHPSKKKKKQEYNTRQNIIWAIQQSDSVLRNPLTTDDEKAVFLAFLVHFVGDIHQPLHVSSYKTKSMPRGDEGGTLYPIRAPHANNLHAFWDSDLGFLTHNKGYPLKRFLRFVSKIEAKHTVHSLATEANNLEEADWARESVLLAKKYAYHIHKNVVPSEDYIHTGRRIALRQIALAGYRLANLLNDEFDKKSN